jgi:hypothetical protein
MAQKNILFWADGGGKHRKTGWRASVKHAGTNRVFNGRPLMDMNSMSPDAPGPRYIGVGGANASSKVVAASTIGKV